MRGRKVAVQVAVALFATVLGWGTAGPAMASTIEYSGRAIALRNTLASNADTGELPTSGGVLHAEELSGGVPGTVTASTLHASTIGQSDYVHSEASAGVVVLTAGVNTVSAEFVMAHAEAQNTDGSVIRTGGSHIDGLLLNGLPVSVTGEPNQTVPLAGGQLVLNEQTNTSIGTSQLITVRALHLTVGDADVAVGTAKAGLTPSATAPPCSPANDYVTGGGWLVPEGQTIKATFGFTGGIKDGIVRGQLTFKNHQNQDRVKGEIIPPYLIFGTERTMFGQGQVNGQSSTFDLNISDNEEPGRSDFFSINYQSQTPGGAAGTLGGGNIQLHPGC